MRNSVRDNTIEEIKNRCNIVDVIGRVVTLKKAGSNYKGRCPFHNEKTPSFVVSEEKQIFTCFGCGATGDVIGFVQKYYSLDFGEAISKLAEECGVVLENHYDRNEKKDEYYEINRAAARFFYRALRETQNKGLAYVEKRGLSRDTLQKFGIGYADPKWDSLYNHLTGLGFSKEKLLELGLISLSKGKYYDKFRDRVIFPIQNTGGKVIGFGGRALGEDGPKYLNSPETPVFHKKNNLYGLNLTRSEIGREDCGILVEGYMDVVSLYQHGVRNVSASLGTALTENQAKLLKRYSHHIVLAYDADAAGVDAALRGMDILHQEACKVRVLHISDGKDPDDFIKKHGKDAFLSLIGEALPYADYKFQWIKSQKDMTSTEGRVSFLQEAVTVLRRLSPVEADFYIKKLSTEYGISEGALRAELGNSPEEPRQSHFAHGQVEIPEMSLIEKNLIKVLLTDSKFLREAKSLAELFQSREGSAIYAAMARLYVPDKEVDQDLLYDLLEEDLIAVVKDIEEHILLAGNEEKVFADCMNKLGLSKLKEKEKLIIAKLSMADEDEHKTDIEQLTEELIKTQRMIQLGGKTN